MDKRTVKKAMILNLCIFILEVFANCWMLSGITVSGNGLIPKAYDWYGFFMMGLKSIVIVLPIIIAATYLMSLCLWKLNKAKVE